MIPRLLAAVVLAAGSTVASSAAFAQSTPGVDARQANQQQRIDAGVASGQLTTREARRLEAGQDRVERMEDRAKSDGTVTARERARLHQAQDAQSARIHAQKHDRQRDLNHDGRRDRPRR